MVYSLLKNGIDSVNAAGIGDETPVYIFVPNPTAGGPPLKYALSSVVVHTPDNSIAPATGTGNDEKYVGLHASGA